MTLPSPSRLAKAALEYAKHRLAIFPLHSVHDGRCSCGATDCTSPGKHPRILNWLQEATTDIKTVAAWWQQWPEANIGCVPGRSRLIVIDIDGSKGEATATSLGLLSEPTCEVRTGRGRHRYYRHPGGHIGNSILGPKVDVRGDAGYVVLPPSLHVSGATYEWEGKLSEAADLPPAIVALLRGPATTAESKPDQLPPWMIPFLNVQPGERNTTMTRFVGHAFGLGHDADTVRLLALGLNSQWTQPLQPREVEAIVHSIETREARKSVEPSDDEDPVASAVAPAALGAAAYHGLAGVIVCDIEPETEADSAALLVQLLLAFGSCVGKGPHIRVGADLHYLNEFALLIGQTSKGRKGTAWGWIHALLEEVDPGWTTGCVGSGLSSGEGVIYAVRDRVERTKRNAQGEETIVVEDEGVADKRLCIVESEFAAPLAVLERDGNTLSSILRLAWDGRSLRVLTKNSPLRSEKPHISLVGHITATELRRRLSRTDLANGFLNRFLLVRVTRSKILPFGGRAPKDVLGNLPRRLQAHLRGARAVGEMSFSSVAKLRWQEVYPALSEGIPGLVGAATNRAEAHVLRLGALYALIDGRREVDRKDLDAALTLWRYAEATARWVFGESLGDPAADTIHRALTAAGTAGMTQTEIRELFGHNKGHAWKAALRSLADSGLVAFTKEDSGGRPRTRWRLSNLGDKGSKAE